MANMQRLYTYIFCVQILLSIRNIQAAHSLCWPKGDLHIAKAVPAATRPIAAFNLNSPISCNRYLFWFTPLSFSHLKDPHGAKLKLNNDKGDKVSNDNIISLIAFKF
jgi:hypothetical protein